jgi:predicted amidohydrolase
MSTNGNMARLIAVGNRINMAATRSEQAFVAELERVVGLAVPHLAADRPNLVVLTELLGLPAALNGWRGVLARQMKTGQGALTALAIAYGWRMRHYRRMYPGISLARALLLSLTDALYRPFHHTLARLASRHRCYLVATTCVPEVRRSTDPADIRRFGVRGLAEVYLPVGPAVYNAALLFGPDGTLIGRTNKVYLTASEKDMLDLSPGRLADVRAFTTAVGRLGIAISLDAFTPDYLRHLDALGVEIVVQPDANDQPWAAPSATHPWQPQEWLNAVLGSVQAEYPHLRYNICAMQTGNFFDIVFDGQSSITAKSARAPDPARNFVGNEGFYHTGTGVPFTGDILAVAPWVAEDPGRADPTLSLAERRQRLRRVTAELIPGGRRANQYRESVIWADITAGDGSALANAASQ